MNEFIQIGIMAGSGAMFAIGGTGPKYVRRFILPGFLGILALLSHVLWWQAIGMAVSLSVALCLPYGERTPYWLKAVVFATYGASFLWIGWSWWVVLCPALCFSLFCLSNWKPTANTFFWKCVEFLYGNFIGITFISVVQHG